jgi:hypothetical protein
LAINLSSQFDVNAQIPLDSRTTVADTTARDAIPAIQRYEGLTVYCLADEKTYQLKGGILNTDWVEFGAGSATDEKVKYDASDPTAGYLADKIIAGTGISVAEGTGVDENKLVITNDDPFDWDYDYTDLINKPDLSVYLTSVKLNEIDNPDGNTTLSMGGNTVTWNFTNPNGGMLFNMTGGWSGHVLEVMDTSVVPNGNLADHLLHLETSRLNVLPAHFVNNAVGGRGLKVEGLTELIGDTEVTGDVTADNLSGTNTGDQVGDGVTITGAGTALDPFVAVSGGAQSPWTSDIETAGYKLLDNAGTPVVSIDPANRTLYNSAGALAMDWANGGYLYSGITGTISVDWQNFKLQGTDDSGNSVTVDWLNRLLKSWDGMYDVNSVDWANRVLYASDGTTEVFNWETKTIGADLNGAGSASITELLTVEANFARGVQKMNGDGNEIVQQTYAGVIGGALYSPLGRQAYLAATGKGSNAFGYVRAGMYGDASIKAEHKGTFAQGYAKESTIKANSQGSFAQGYSLQNYLQAAAKGTFAQGYNNGIGLKAYAIGSFAQGAVYSGWFLNATGFGSFAQGFARNGHIYARGGGSFAQGLAYNGSIEAYDGGFAQGKSMGSRVIRANKGGFAQGFMEYFAYGGIYADKGAMAQGFIGAQGGKIHANKSSFAQGYTYFGSYVYASGYGSFAQGYAGSSKILAFGKGSFARGAVNKMVYGYIKADGPGSFAQGYISSGYKVLASGAGSFAFGNPSMADIEATGNGSVQFGEGTNAEADSISIKSGVRIHGGVPMTPRNGDIWVYNNYVYVQSYGTSVKII